MNLTPTPNPNPIPNPISMAQVTYPSKTISSSTLSIVSLEVNLQTGYVSVGLSSGSTANTFVTGTLSGANLASCQTIANTTITNADASASIA